ncbi:Ammonium transporter 1 [Phytophthora nicotianae]|uniref:Ammonium transporter 1 n=1 Tax=Phytophthora nicotianae TaxID=4792 RepID=A0A0W8DK41_PHYNI|nr:Ammonium transporter 1 [Phytophthora nicotianae]
MDELAAQVLPPDSAAKLLRVFCFLRQHDRKTRIARKTAELNAWRVPPPVASQRADDGFADEELQQASPTEVMPDKTDLLSELNLLAASEEPDGSAKVVSGTRSKNGGAGSRNATAVSAKTSDMHDLRSEIKELQKGVNTSNSDTSGVITAADLSSCMRSLNRVPSKVVVMGAGIVSKAFVQAYQQAVHNARSGNAGAMAAKTVVRKNQMPKQQAREILNFPTTGPAPSSEEIQKQFTRYFEANDPAKGGSFYLQSKIFRAKEALERKEPDEEAPPTDKAKDK